MNGRAFRVSIFFDVAHVFGLTVFVGVFLALLGFCVLPEAFAAPPLSRPEPVVSGTTQVRGAEGTGSCGGGYGLGVGLVDLEHGLGAGATTYDHGGFLWCATYTPYLWSDKMEDRHCVSSKEVTTGRAAFMSRAG